MRSFISRFPVLVFVVLTLAYQFVVVGVVWARLPEGGHIHDDEFAHMVFRLRVFGPLAFAVLLTAYLEGMSGIRRLFGSFFRWKVPAKWYLLAFSWKFMFTYIGIGVLVLLGLHPWPGFIVPDFFGGTWTNLISLAKSMPFIIGIALVEETAWMKYSVTRMQEKYSALTSCLLVGLSWGLWYLPMLLIREGVPDGYPWPVFLLSMVCLTILLAWTYNMTRSGTILLIMQIVSNCAFFILPVLPGHWHLDATYINAFVAVNCASALLLVLVYGWRELGITTRAKWSDVHDYEDAPESEDPGPVVKPVNA
jgi:uncharacterized protein